MRRTALAILIATSLSMAYAENWPGWRGPGSLGISTEKRIPMQWDLSKNVKYKVEVPGLGHSPPIVWGDRIFITTAVNIDPKESDWQKGFPRIERKPDASDISWKVLCFHRDTGKLLWEQTAVRRKPINPRHTKNSYASQTPVTDGKHVYAFFADQGFIACYEVKTGKEVYGRRRIDVGAGFSASPVVVDGKLHCASEEGDVYVIKAGPEYELLAKNSIGESIMASPAVSGGKMFIRAIKHLYCIQ